MRLLVSWVRDFVDVTAPAEEIAEKLALRGFEVAAIETRRRRRRRHRLRGHRQSSRLPERARLRARNRHALRPARPCSRRPKPARASSHRAAADRTVRSPEGHDRGCRALPALRRGGRRRDAGDVAALDDRPAAGRRRPADQPDRRHHELRADRARPSDARLRPGDARRAASCGSGGRASGETITTLDGVDAHARRRRCSSSPTANGRRPSPA